MDETKLADLRRDYSSRQLSRASVAADPITQFSIWMDEARSSQVIDPNAMTASTVDLASQPSSRIVLLKHFGQEGFVFYTNYESKKAADLETNPGISLHFFWPDLERQVVISGTAVKTSVDESKAYFASRPTDSKIGAWASKQSSVLAGRKELEDAFRAIEERFRDLDVPCPPFWGGFRVTPSRVEFWQGRASRLHDRICYERMAGVWKIVRLSP